MEKHEPTVWRAYCRERGRGTDFAPQAVQGGYVAFGGDRSDPVTDFASKQAFVRMYASHYPDGAIRAGQVWTLYEKSQSGDWVLMPDRDARRVHIGRMSTEGYSFVPDDPACRFAHRFAVDWLGDVTYERAREVCGSAVVGQGALVRLDVPAPHISQLLGDASNGVIEPPAHDATATYARWADRARRTAALIQAAYDHAATTHRLSGRTVAALCRLTWFTRGKGGQRDPFGANVARQYWRTTKLPGLIELFDLPGDTKTLDAAAVAIAEHAPEAVDPELIPSGTGFDHFYNAYRGVVPEWCERHAHELLSLIARARVLESNVAGRRLAEAIESLPPLTIADGAKNIPAAKLLMPVLACLDPRGQFPIINGADSVQDLLRRLGLAHAPLADQHDGLVRLIDPNDPKRRDAFGLDQHGADAATVLVRPQPKRDQPLTRKPTEGKHLQVKDSRDIEAIVRGGRRRVRRVHNDMTNALEKLCRESFVVLEGLDSDCMYDALVRDYDGHEHDLLIEAKSSTERGVLRLAVGQLLDYRRGLSRREKTDLAVLLPSEPDPGAIAFLRHVDVRILWFEGANYARIVGDWGLGPTATSE